jgi:hypothetical protein
MPPAGALLPVVHWRILVIGCGLTLACVLGLSVGVLSASRPADEQDEPAIMAVTPTPPPAAVEPPVTAPFVAPPAAAVKLALAPPEPVAPPPPAPVVPDEAVCMADEGTACGVPQTYGTSVAFLATPAEAARQARREQKLLFVLHISGNFEDSRFT